MLTFVQVVLALFRFLNLCFSPCFAHVLLALSVLLLFMYFLLCTLGCVRVLLGLALLCGFSVLELYFDEKGQS